MPASSSALPISSHLSPSPEGSALAASAHGVAAVSIPSPAASAVPIMPDALNPNAHDFIPITPSMPSESALDSLLTALTLPRHDLICFEGDITRYQAFIAGFDLRVGRKHVSDEEKLHILYTYLKGEPRELISGCFHMHPSAGYFEARRLLAKAYGDAFRLSMAYRDRLIAWPPIKNGDIKQLRKFSSFLSQCIGAMTGSEHAGVLNSPDTLRQAVQKLPHYLQNKWLKEAHSVAVRGNLVTLHDIAKFVELAADIASDPIFGTSQGISAQGQAISTAHRETNKSSFATNIESSHQKTCSICHGEGHVEPKCAQLLSIQSVSDRKAMLREQGLCFSCLGRGHISRFCRSRLTCEVCHRGHPTALHVERDKQELVETKGRNDESPISCHSVTLKDARVFHAVLPVVVSAKDSGHRVMTYCFLDNGSNGCFMSDDLYKQLQVKGRESVLQLNTMHGATYENCNVIESLVMTDWNGNNETELPKVYSRPHIPMGDGNVAHTGLCQQIPQLKEFAHLLPKLEYVPNAPIGILLGNNCSLLQPLQVKSSKDSSLFAVRYRHGWTVQGSTHSNADTKVTCNRIAVSESLKEVPFSSQVLKILERDFVDAVSRYPDEKGPSVEDRKFLKIVTNEIEFTEGHYVVPLPIRDRSVQLPNNRSQAFSRLLWQRKKMMADEAYFSDYVAFMSKLFEQQHCEPVTKQVNGSGDVWYLPHHGVYHPQKRKLRIVFDCSARFQGLCLNDILLQGPNLINSLFGVLTRFRFEPVTFVADLEAMYYQVRVPPKDRSYLRFLWFAGNDLRGDIVEYQMSVHIFGAVSSPSVANFVLQKVATNSLDYQVRDTLLRNFYVDDCLCSQESIVECRSLIERLSSACKQGGFRLTKFISNNVEVLSSIPVNERAKDVQSIDLVKEDLPMAQALGVLWHVNDDTFGFRIQTSNANIGCVTRRNVLSFICSMYDPFGFIAPVVLPGKAIMQELCRLNQGWDEPLSDEMMSRWLNWVNALNELNRLSIPRCFKSGLGCTLDGAQLHVFSDASTVGYGAVAYLRLIDNSGVVRLAFVAGKARLAPTKVQTIPKLEMTAATVSVRLACAIQKEMAKDLRVIYHTDSSFVWHCLHNEQRRFPVYIANRLQFIRDFSNPDQWRYVPSRLNPADEASRGLSPLELVVSAVWLKGPNFLLGGEGEWPKVPHSTEKVPSSEVHAIQCDDCLATTDCTDTPTPTDRLLAYFSSWIKLSRTVAIFRRLRKTKTAKSTPLNASEIADAQQAICRYIQKHQFADEIDRLNSLSKASKTQRKQALKKSSSLFKLDPFLDAAGLIRVGGRLRKTDWEETAKNPVVLPRKHHVTGLIIRHEHIKAGHAGRNHVLSNLRAKFWVPQGNAAVRHVISQCIHCKRGRGPCMTQAMADLPKCRVDDSVPPFSHVGVDYFGPFDAKLGRKSVKRFGVLFTCMVSRAIHLELAPALDTSAFIHALRRFLSRRGPAKAFYSDNGTNFVGAVNELKRAQREMDGGAVQRWLANEGCEWHFNPPSASHMGGAWERAIATVRQVLYGVMREVGVTPDDDTLHTIFCEVENVVNSRPLTTVTSDPQDLDPITPNHVLTGKSSILLPPLGNFQRADLYMRKRWRRTQYIVNLFWTRWRKEFLSAKQPRAKWQRPQRNLIVGDIVLIKEEAPRNSWPLARVTAVHKDDGVVRHVTVASRHARDLQRPVHKLVLLLANT